MPAAHPPAPTALLPSPRSRARQRQHGNTIARANHPAPGERGRALARPGIHSGCSPLGGEPPGDDTLAMVPVIREVAEACRVRRKTSTGVVR